MKLFHRQIGSGTDLIILHGLLGISDNWIPFGKKLAENFNVIIPDLRNHGRSGHSNEFDYNYMSEDILELIQTLNLKTPVLVGHSMGGKLAMNLAVNHPELFPKIIVVDISPKDYEIGKLHESVLDFMLSVDFSKISSRKEVEELVCHKFEERNTCFWILKNLYKKNKTEFGWRANVEVINKNILEVKKGLLPNQISKVPALFIKGGKSDYINLYESHLRFQGSIKYHFPNSEIKEIEQASHWVHADAPEDLSEMILKFIG
ncbi:MAG: alpha/beta fold hydrolase [Saprospiraceae bacterium]|nr:alpha/beta fold hydrolase [Saprospiraceae bacterium]